MDDRLARHDLDLATMRGLAASRWLLPIVLLLIVALPRPPLAATGELRFVLDAPSSWPLVLSGALLFLGSELLARSRWVVEASPARAATVVLVLDVVALTLVLAGSHAAHNPLTALYFVPLTLATQVSPRTTWWVAVCAALGFLALFFVPMPTHTAHVAHAPHAAPASTTHPPGHGAAGHDSAGHDSAGHGSAGDEASAQTAPPTHEVTTKTSPEDPFHDHLRGMWIAFAVSGMLLTLSLRRIAFAVEAQRAELLRLRRDADDDRHLAGLASLAAGAAHELGTPLQNIGLLVDELEDPTADRTARREAVDDVRGELERCRQILRTMASPELAISGLGSDLPSWTIASLAAELERVGHDDVVVDVTSVLSSALVTDIPREIVGQILRELVKNAVVACHTVGGQHTVRVDVSTLPGQTRSGDKRTHGDFVCTVEDDGPGIGGDDVERVFRPFHSSHASHRGLGLFIARAQVRRLGGELTLRAREGGGTIARVQLPLMMAEAASSVPTQGATPRAPGSTTATMSDVTDAERPS
jgi:two-component system sensor histidine kinase RegB